MRPFRLPDEHLPSIADGWICRACSTAWPCETAGEHLTSNPCTCGQTVYREKHGPRNWHLGERCYGEKDIVRWQAAELAAARRPHYPPSHFYPAKPARRRRQRPPIPRHRVTGPGDIRPGTWTWVKPGSLHPGWGDIHHLAMLTTVGPWCEVWLILDGTVHDVRADRLLLDGGPRRNRAAWWNWTVAEHLERQGPGGQATEVRTAVQPALFDGLMPL